MLSSGTPLSHGYLVHFHVLHTQVNLEHGADLPLPPPKPFVRQQQQQQDNQQQREESQQQQGTLHLPPSDGTVEIKPFRRHPEVGVRAQDFSGTPRTHDSTASGGSSTEEDYHQENNDGYTSGDDGTRHGNGIEISSRKIANNVATPGAGTNRNDTRSGSTVEATDSGFVVGMAAIAEIDDHVDATTGTDEDEGDQHEHLHLISHLLERFAVLYRQSRLEEAAVTSQQTLRLMEGMRRKRREKAAAAAPTEHKSAENIAALAHIPDNGGAKENMSGWGADGKKRVVKDEGGSGWGESRILPADIVKREHVSLRSEEERDYDEIGRLELEKTSAEASAIAGVMNDLGCTLQQVNTIDFFVPDFMIAAVFFLECNRVLATTPHF